MSGDMRVDLDAMRGGVSSLLTRRGVTGADGMDLLVVLGLRPDDALPVPGIQNEQVQRILREGVRSTTVYVRLREERDWHTKASSAVPFRVVECEAPSMDVSGTFERGGRWRLCFYTGWSVSSVGGARVGSEHDRR